jgi:hydroxymethylpyrimidine/phosphomethylpyrimidine kinase
MGSAVLSYMKEHPNIRSAINLLYDEKILAICKRNFKVAAYDRRAEPRQIKVAEGRSIPWGIESALRMDPNADIIYHLGDIGKEPMIMVFDTNPSRLVGKVNNILIEFLK